MVDPCTNRMRSQIQEELKAAMKYLQMAAYFSRDTVNRPGFAKLFFEAASEEREHAIKLIEYLLMRGELTSGLSSLISRTVSSNLILVFYILVNICFVYRHLTPTKQNGITELQP